MKWFPLRESIVTWDSLRVCLSVCGHFAPGQRTYGRLVWERGRAWAWGECAPLEPPVSTDLATFLCLLVVGPAVLQPRLPSVPSPPHKISLVNQVRQKEYQHCEWHSSRPVPPEAWAPCLSEDVQGDAEYGRNTSRGCEEHGDQRQSPSRAGLQDGDAAANHAVERRQGGSHAGVVCETRPEFAVQIEEIGSRRAPV